jgi:hypothetical protein
MRGGGDRHDAWILIRRPLLLLFFIGCTVSMAASGRLTARLVVDGALSFAFIPIIEAAAFAVVYRRSTRPIPFPHAADRFCETNGPWFVVLAACAAMAAVLTPQQMMKWTTPPGLWIVIGTAAVAAVWSGYLDVVFFRRIAGRTQAAAVIDALIFRAVAWPAAIVYFFGYALWPSLVQWSRA